MSERTTPESLQSALDEAADDSPFADLVSVWTGLADALWLATLRAVLAPDRLAPQPAPVRAPSLVRDRAA